MTKTSSIDFKNRMILHSHANLLTPQLFLLVREWQKIRGNPYCFFFQYLNLVNWSDCRTSESGGIVCFYPGYETANHIFAIAELLRGFIIQSTFVLWSRRKLEIVSPQMNCEGYIGRMGSYLRCTLVTSPRCFSILRVPSFIFADDVVFLAASCFKVCWSFHCRVWNSWNENQFL